METLTTGSVLDIRIVAENAESRMEWRKIVDEDDSIIWKPYQVDREGNVMVEPKWMPLPGSQYLFLGCPIFEALYAGTRGPGKTLTLVMDFAKDIDKGHGNSWRGVLFRRTYSELEDVVKKTEEWFPKFFPQARLLKSKSEYMYIWPTGEALLFRHLMDERDYPKYHGHEYPWMGFEEITQWPNDKAFRKMQSCCRSSNPKIVSRIRATTNPYGVGHNWVKKRYKLPDHYGKVIRIPGERDRVAIQGMLRENFVLLHSEPDYEITIKNAASNPAEATAWLRGDWNVTAGGMIDDIWATDIHVLPTFPVSVIPRGWTITRSYDHGQSHPFSVQWWIESNGEPIEFEDGRYLGNVRGDLILWAEWYGTSGNENEGLRMSARKIAQGILDREEDLNIKGKVRPGPADTEIWSPDSRGTGIAPANDMEDVGIYWERADKRPGSRKRGWEMMRTFLQDAIPNFDGSREKPGMFVCDRNRHWLNLVPQMPRDDTDLDDVPKTYEDHGADCSRYRLSWQMLGMSQSDF